MTYNTSNSLQNGSEGQTKPSLQEYRLMLDEIAKTIKSSSSKLLDIESAATTPVSF